jgi:hypothetical protein
VHLDELQKWIIDDLSGGVAAKKKAISPGKHDQ